jgi:hypothetical protein
MGAFDILFGIPQARAQIAASLGQGPGQPGNPAGPQPLAGPPPAAGGPPGGGGGAGPPTGAAPPGGAPAGPPQGPPAAPPQPQAYQSPPDLVNMYMQFAQRQQASDQFSRGLAGMAMALHPGRHTGIMDVMTGGQQDPGEMFGNILKLQQYAQQQGQLAAYRQGLPGVMSKYNLDPSLGPLLAANPDILSKIVETRAGVGGDAVTQELRQARSDWHDQNPGKSDADMLAAHPEYSGVVEFTANKAAATNEAAAKAKDLAADQHSFADANADYTQTEQMLGWLKAHPEATAAAVHAGAMASGRMGQLGQAAGLLPADAATAAGYLAQLQGKLYSEGWKGRGGRLSQLEAGKISEGFSQLNNPALPDDQITNQIGTLYDKTRTAHANTYGAAGMPTPADLYGIMDDAYKPGGKLHTGASSLKAPSDQGGGQTAGKPLSGDDLAQAKALMARDGRDAVIAHLKANGYDTSGL